LHNPLAPLAIFVLLLLKEIGSKLSVLQELTQTLQELYLQVLVLVLLVLLATTVLKDLLSLFPVLLEPTILLLDNLNQLHVFWQLQECRSVDGLRQELLLV